MTRTREAIESNRDVVKSAIQQVMNRDGYSLDTQQRLKKLWARLAELNQELKAASK